MKQVDEPTGTRNREIAHGWVTVDTKISMKHPDVISWCNNYPSNGRYLDNFRYNEITWYFEKEEDASMFALVWIGQL